jgi:dihydroorotase
MNPPLRSEENRLETVKALLDGTASIIASDHAPHAEHEKNKEYSDCLNGIIGIETMVPIIYTHFIKTGIATLDQFVNWFVNNPRKLFKLPESKIYPGFAANLTVLDVKTVRKYEEKEILSLSKNTPYIGMELTGFPRFTIVNGNIVWRD